MPKYVSAEYVADELSPSGARIRAVGDDGKVYYLPEDCTQSDWLDYFAQGGAVTPITPLANKNIIEAPKNLFGGPTLKEVFNGN